MLSIRFLVRCVTGFLLAAAFVSVSGCSGDPGPVRVDIKGKATFAGTPIASGAITFMPDNSKGNSGPATNAEIKNGEYTTVNAGKGIVGGPHIIRISGFDGVPKPDEELPMGTPLFPEFSMNADLPKAESGSEPVVHDIEVPKEAADPSFQQNTEVSDGV